MPPPLAAPGGSLTPRSFPRALPIVLALAGLLMAAAPAAPASLPALGVDLSLPAGCAAWIDVPGQGPSCPVDHGWVVRLRDGETLLTHGPDRHPSDETPEDHVPTSLVNMILDPGRPVACTEDPATYHNLLVYAVPADRPNQYLDMDEHIRHRARQANAKLHADAQEFGTTADYVFLCSGGVPVVVNATLPTSSASDSFSTITSDLRALGHQSTYAKYWVWYHDAVACGCVGQGNIRNDDRLVLGNANNAGPSYGVSYQADWRTMMHESGHNHGAVQLSAPHTSGGWHCNDDFDVMCYDDGGSASGGYSDDVCATEHFDCNHDDYFHPFPPAGSYLATHWNLGSCLHRFVRMAHC
ncbi:MAG TPA: hypothetical protein VHH36_08810 [Candidatus Thermoplasmatota archaeon]|nr:hypothetical protein [Candidatus Thermoplasmatota archaeon]